MDEMRKFEGYSGSLTRFTLLLLLALAAGCGDTPTDFTSIAVTPPIASIAVGGTQQFTATGTPSGSTATTSDITNTVTWTSSATTVATISPSGLATGVKVGSATITATSGGTTSTPVTLTVIPAPPSLASAATFGSIGGAAGIRNEGTLTVVNGDIGTTGASTLVTGFHDPGPGCVYTEVTAVNIGSVTGTIFTNTPPPLSGTCPTEGTAATAATAVQALSDAQQAFNKLLPAVVPGGTDQGAELGGLTLFSGVYTATGGSFQITGSDLVLDGGGNANSSWVFQMTNSLTVGDPGAPRTVFLTGNAQAKNVFWQVGSTATINAAGGGTMVGTIISSGATTISATGNTAIVTLIGRALALNGPVSMVNTVINVPPP